MRRSLAVLFGGVLLMGPVGYADTDGLTQQQREQMLQAQKAQQEAVRQAMIKKQQEMQKKELERQKQEALKKELERQKQEALKKELERQKQEALKKELERQKQEALKKQLERQKQEALKKELERQKQEALKKQLERQKLEALKKAHEKLQAQKLQSQQGQQAQARQFIVKKILAKIRQFTKKQIAIAKIAARKGVKVGQFAKKMQQQSPKVDEIVVAFAKDQRLELEALEVDPSEAVTVAEMEKLSGKDLDATFAKRVFDDHVELIAHLEAARVDADGPQKELIDRVLSVVKETGQEALKLYEDVKP